MKEYLIPSVLALTFISACDQGDARQEMAEDTIVGGSPTTIQNHPWQISLRSTTSSHFCGGSIIAPDWILTAAHCVQGESVSSLRVVAGVTRLSESSGGQTRSVSRVIVYPGYTNSENGKDAALLQLTQPLDLSTANARAIPIATPADVAAGRTNPGVNAVVSGWGTLNQSSYNLPDVLQHVTVPLVSNEDAIAAYGAGSVTSDQIAAGVMGTGGRDSCQGDSGGPLTVPSAGGGRLLAGIVSWGNGCGDPDYPGMYGRVSSFAPWIQGYVTNNVAPQVRFTSPSDGATVSGVVTFTAAATDADGTVVDVRFTFPDGSVVDDTAAPFSATWNTASLPDGDQVVLVQAFDDIGASSTVVRETVKTSNGVQTCPLGTFASSDTPLAIPDNNPSGVASSIAVGASGSITALRLSLSITHTYRGDLKVTLVSPSGTSFVVHDRAGGSADNLVVSNQAVAAFNGVSASGTWRLQVVDMAGQDVGRIESWSLDIASTCTSGPWAAMARPNRPTVDKGSICETVTVTGSGNASDVKLDISGTHDWRSILRATLEHNGTVVEAFPTSTFGRGSGTFSFKDRRVAGLSGSASGVWKLCLIDTDGYNDKGVLSSWGVHN